MSISNSNFAGYTGSKNLVQTRQKFQFIKLDFPNSIFENPSADRYREKLAHFLSAQMVVLVVGMYVYLWSGACFIDVARTCRVYYVNANQYSFHDQIATFSFQMNTE